MIRLGFRLYVIALLTALPGPANAQTAPGPITLTLGCNLLAPDTSVYFTLTLSNVGDTDTAVRLGAVQGGRPIGMKNVYVVHGLELSVDKGDPESAETFKLMPRIGFVAGWLDEWLIPLPVGASYTLSIQAARFHASTSHTGLTLSTPATVRAILHTSASKYLNHDVWSGRLDSNTIVAPDECTSLAPSR